MKIKENKRNKLNVCIKREPMLLCWLINISDKKFIINSYRNKSRLKRNKNRIYEIIDQNGGFKYAFDKMLYLKEKNLLIIDNFPENKSKESLKLMLDYLINRKN